MIPASYAGISIPLFSGKFEFCQVIADATSVEEFVSLASGRVAPLDTLKNFCTQ
jgi:hypothetical protein